MNRISKPPEIRKREILEVAKKIFLEKGYEKTSMADIANTLEVTQGLCYRYFKSKQELFEVAIDEYANECSQRFIDIIKNGDKTYVEKIKTLSNLMIELENPNGLNSYYHKAGNEVMHEQLELRILITIKGEVESFLKDLVSQGVVKNIDNIKSVNSFITYGIFGVLKCEGMDIREKVESICEYLGNILDIDFKNLIFK